MFSRLLARRGPALATAAAAAATGAGVGTAAFSLAGEEPTAQSASLLHRLRHRLRAATATATATAFAAAPAGLVASCDSAPMTGSRLFSFGSNSHGQLGVGDEKGREGPALVEKLERMGVRCVSSFLYNTACVGGDGQVYTWGCGANARNGTGTGNVSNQTVPVALRELRSEGVVRVAVGGKHSACVTEDGRVFSWGRSFGGALGRDGGKDGRPGRVQGELEGKTVSSLDCGMGHTAVVTTDGEVYVWGQAREGQLGLGDDRSSRPQATPALLDLGSGEKASQVACGRDFTLVLTGDGTVLSFGADDYGQLGQGGSGSGARYRRSPGAVDLSEVVSGDRVVRITAGAYHAAALTAKGDLLTWGRGEAGQLGHGSRTNSAVPIKVEGLPASAAAISCGAAHTAALDGKGRVFLWGQGRSGQLGRGTDASRKESSARKVEAPAEPCEFFVRGDKKVNGICCGGDSTFVVVE